MTTRPVAEPAIVSALRQVIDPELGCNVIDLGLIYGVRRHGNKVWVTMTLTTPGCPMHESIAHGVQLALLSVPGIDDVEVELVWEPPWNPTLASPEARGRLGIKA